jgi:hypothetical protein
LRISVVFPAWVEPLLSGRHNPFRTAQLARRRLDSPKPPAVWRPFAARGPAPQGPARAPVPAPKARGSPHLVPRRRQRRDGGAVVPEAGAEAVDQNDRPAAARGGVVDPVAAPAPGVPGPGPLALRLRWRWPGALLLLLLLLLGRPPQRLRAATADAERRDAGPAGSGAAGDAAARRAGECGAAQCC